jgi:hypothetical protein
VVGVYGNSVYFGYRSVTALQKLQNFVDVDVRYDDALLAATAP